MDATLSCMTSYYSFFGSYYSIIIDGGQSLSYVIYVGTQNQHYKMD
jgi:hypothetical protein